MAKISDNYTGQIYDDLYKNKPYLDEVNKILPYINGKSIIDIGGGSGGHSVILKEKGFETKIIDISESMLEVARSKGLDAEWGDFDSYKSDKKFDTAISMFHVMNFSKDLFVTFKNVSSLLTDGGVFIFDFWNNTVKKEGSDFRWDGLLTRFVKKRWEGDRVFINFFFPFLLKGEAHMLYCPSKEHVLEQLQRAGFKVVNTSDNGLEYLFIVKK